MTVISIVRESFTEQRAAEADEAAARVHAHLSAGGLEVDKVVLRGDPAALIVETAGARGRPDRHGHARPHRLGARAGRQRHRRRDQRNAAAGARGQAVPAGGWSGGMQCTARP
ncbi:MAG: hypothetical protein L6Q72_10255 [Burkholderiaceae bacterium]|nr:hypothetical protein [Burkholderiaceae bacterium]